MKVEAIRELFLNYFAQHKHTIVPSHSLIPYNDDTLLFINAGMVPFKEVFLGREIRDDKRACAVQRCLRAGGKHNDLANVGYTARHHTFFEMLGNFSFGDYFKEQAIVFAWNFLTQQLKLAPEKLWITVYDTDDEAAEIWLNKIKVDPNRLSRCGKADNFWSMGDTGPCGPSSEIFYDHGPEVPGGPPGSAEQDGDRYIEIWNLVFMQYNRLQDGSLQALPKPSVDTGMGLERLAAVMQGVNSNYAIDTFQSLIRSVAQILEVNNTTDMSLRVIADHIRAAAFLVSDGILPTNEGRGYVLRRIIRRALRHGHKISERQPFFYQLVVPLISEMGRAYPELKQNKAHIEKVLFKEEQQFAKTLALGLKILEQDLAKLAASQVPGAVAFKLYDTYGFPFDLTADIAREKGLTVDEVGFRQAMEAQRARARQASQFSGEFPSTALNLSESNFTGYYTLEDQGQVLHLLNQQGDAVSQLALHESGSVILDNTPFYAQAGGQVGDQGDLRMAQNLFKVTDTQQRGAAVLHMGQMQSGELAVGDSVLAVVDAKMRQAIRLNHSATHLLHAALRKIVGPKVVQKGSLVTPEKLRFDFAHDEPLTEAQLLAIEHCVNEEIRKNLPVVTEIMSVEQAMQAGAVALFGEKYAAKVRVLTMGDKFSMELCGGTHVNYTGDIGVLQLTQESGIAAGIRRIEAVTGQVALTYRQAQTQQLKTLAAQFKTEEAQLLSKTEQWLQQFRQLERDNEQLTGEVAKCLAQALTTKAQTIGNIAVLAQQLPTGDAQMLRRLLDSLKAKLKTAVIVLAVVNQERISLLAGVTANCTHRFAAGELVNFVAKQVGGKGGGRADMAQAGGNHPEALEKALTSVYTWVQQKI
jgi:alanyl-tRNA synthetase